LQSNLQKKPHLNKYTLRLLYNDDVTNNIYGEPKCSLGLYDLLLITHKRFKII